MITGKMTTIARPYAVAAFEFASAKNTLPAWEAMLDAAAILAEDPAVQRLLTNPRVTVKQLAKFYSDVLAKSLDSDRANFIHLLAEYNRLPALPEIAALFKQYQAAKEKTLTVQVTSAVNLDEKYKHKLAAALTKRFKRQVSLECNIDADLLGGAIIAAGDTVIDGSIRGKLSRMIEFISGISLR
ncbi:MAG: F0F1 ATP synthase subunit delta [Gammaproteobacteria bacterium]